MRTLSVPLDHRHPESGSKPLRYELGRPWQPGRPAVLVVADGQQYYMRPGAAGTLQKEVFGDDFNVVGILSRGGTPEFVSAALDPSGKPDWQAAWTIFNADQWLEDIDAVRRAVIGPAGRVSLYGRSGGAYLVHQYLAKHGAHVDRAYTQSAVSPALNRELRIPIESFWQELGKQDPGLQTLLSESLGRRPSDRQAILVALQRQHFFVAADQLGSARAALIRTIAQGDEAAFAKARLDYQVDQVLALCRSTDAVPQMVRELELLDPAAAFDPAPVGMVRPLIDSQREFLGPLLDLMAERRIPAPAFDLAPAHRLFETEVFILAGRWDEAVDYRTQIALAHAYPRELLFIANDNHVFTGLDKKGVRSQMIRAFLRAGLGSSEMDAALRAAEPLRWREHEEGPSK
jgi:pimeloyl-ACP methyl ester carboxylesterase